MRSSSRWRPATIWKRSSSRTSSRCTKCVWPSWRMARWPRWAFTCPGAWAWTRGENILAMVITGDYAGYLYFFFANGKCAPKIHTSALTPPSKFAASCSRHTAMGKTLADTLPARGDGLAIRTSASRMLLVGTAQISLFVTCGDIFPGAGKSVPVFRPGAVLEAYSSMPRSGVLRRLTGAQAPSTGSGPAQGWRLCPPMLQAVYDTAARAHDGHEAPSTAPSPAGRMRGTGAEAPRQEAVSPPGKRQEKTGLTKFTRRCAAARQLAARRPLSSPPSRTSARAVVLRRQGIRP